MRWLLLFILAAGCATAKVEQAPTPLPAPAPPPPPPVKSGPDTWTLPDGCLLNLRGEWRDAGGRSFSIEDDGETVLLRPLHDASLGAQLVRTDEGFVGFVEGQVTSAGGRPCQVPFRARVTACTPNALVFEVERAFLVDEACRRLPGPGEFEVVRLFR